MRAMGSQDCRVRSVTRLAASQAKCDEVNCITRNIHGDRRPPSSILHRSPERGVLPAHLRIKPQLALQASPDPFEVATVPLVHLKAVVQPAVLVHVVQAAAPAGAGRPLDEEEVLDPRVEETHRAEEARLVREEDAQAGEEVRREGRFRREDRRVGSGALAVEVRDGVDRVRGGVRQDVACRCTSVMRRNEGDRRSQGRMEAGVPRIGDPACHRVLLNRHGSASAHELRDAQQSSLTSPRRPESSARSHTFFA